MGRCSASYTCVIHVTQLRSLGLSVPLGEALQAHRGMCSKVMLLSENQRKQLNRDRCTEIHTTAKYAC